MLRAVPLNLSEPVGQSARKLMPGERLPPGVSGYGFSQEDLSRGGRNSAEKHRERKERHRRLAQGRRRGERLEFGPAYTWPTGRDAGGRWLPGKARVPAEKTPERIEVPTKRPPPPPPSSRPRPPRGLAECEICYGWSGLKRHLVLHVRMAHAPLSSPWHPRRAWERSAAVRRVRVEERERMGTPTE